VLHNFYDLSNRFSYLLAPKMPHSVKDDKLIGGKQTIRPHIEGFGQLIVQATRVQW
jgi:hypothetical protein